MLKNKISQGFTLAEVLITLGIIGVVASMTIPTLVADYQKRTYDTAATTFERKLGEALKVMNSQQTLAGFSSTEDFVEELSKHFKVTKTCSNDKLLDCFGEEIFWGGGEATPEAIDMSTIKTSKHFGLDNWEQTNIVGVQFASGVTALIAYNTNASQDPYSNQIITFSGSSNGRSGSVRLGTDSLAILYDTNGAKSPNKSAKDLRSINVSRLGNSGCFAEINGVCITMQPQEIAPHIWNACDYQSGTTTDPDDLAFMSKYGIDNCYSEPPFHMGINGSYEGIDYWAAAAEACGGVNKMASMAQIAKIADYVYNTNGIGALDRVENLTLDGNKAAELGLPSEGFGLWSKELFGYANAYSRSFYTDSTMTWNDGRESDSGFAICVE